MVTIFEYENYLSLRFREGVQRGTEKNDELRSTDISLSDISASELLGVAPEN